MEIAGTCHTMRDCGRGQADGYDYPHGGHDELYATWILSGACTAIDRLSEDQQNPNLWIPAEPLHGFS